MSYKFYVTTDEYVRGRYIFDIEASSKEEAEQKFMHAVDNNEACTDHDYLGGSIIEMEGWGKNVEATDEEGNYIYLPEGTHITNLDHYEDLKKTIFKHAKIIKEDFDKTKGCVHVTVQTIFKPKEYETLDPENILLFDGTHDKPENHRIIGVVDLETLKKILPKNAKGVRIHPDNLLLAIY